MRARAAVVAVVLLLAACGQKQGVHLAASEGGGGAALNGEPTLAPDTADGAAQTTGSAAGPSIDDVAGREAADAQSVGAQQSSRAAAASSGGVPRGPVWGDKVVIGIHAPITGAAPLPSTFTAAAKVYPEYINAKGGINGRKLEVVIVDDKYTPSTATQVCTELIKQRNAFLVIGGGGTDQIQACARTSQGAGVPYLSFGVTEVGLRSLKSYFALSMSYPQQGPHLANFIRKQFPDKAGDVAIVYSDTPNFEDARDTFVKAMPDAKVHKLSRNPSQSELASAARALCTSGVKVAYPLMAPTNWLFLASQTKPMCAIQWSGVGVTKGLNSVASTGCRANNSVDGATFFSPFPGIDRAPAMDPEFAEAVRGKQWDDIYVAVWALVKTSAKLLERAGPDLTRAGFVASTEATTNLAAGMAPVLSYTPNDHFGARHTHVLRANCAKQQFETLATFASY